MLIRQQFPVRSSRFAVPISHFPLCLVHSTFPRLPASLLFALCSLPFTLFAQYFTIGTDPESVKWQRLKSEHFRVIYPAELDSSSQFVANAFEHIYLKGTKALDSKPGKWPVILHNRTITSNAFTPYAPKRIEILTTPPQDSYAQRWLDQLVIHEFRHAVQYGSVNRGFTKALSYVFGQQATAGVLGLFGPMWFIEGDATVQETAMSQSGRGRSPSLEMGLRAQFLEKGIYSYDKAYNGSYKDYIPDWYELGYLLVGYTRVKHGMDAWSPVIERVGKYPFMLVPFSTGLHKQTGKGKSRLYEEIADSLASGWERQAEKIAYTPYQRISPSPGKNYTQYDEAVFLNDSLMVVDKVRIDDVNRFMLIDFKGNEKVLITPGLGMLDDALSAAHGMVCWAEESRDPRWPLQNYAILKIYDVASGRQRQLTHLTRYFAPIITDDGSRILAVESPPDGQYAIVVLDAATGEVLHRVTSPENYFYSQPNWSPDGKLIVSTVLGKQGKSLAIADPETGRMRTIISFGYQDIGEPVFYGRFVIYRAPYSGIDNIYAADTSTGEIFQVTSARFGASGPVVSPDGKLLIYSNYTATGNELVCAVLDPSAWKPLSLVEDHSLKLYEPLTEQMNFIFDPDSVPKTGYTSKPYRKGLNLFNFHSWAPLAVDIDNMDINPGVTLLSQNLLGTSYTTLGYEYNLNEETGKYFLKYSYEGFYPAIDLNMDYGLRRGIHLEDSTGEQIKYNYHELNLAAGLRIPLNWYARSWFVGFQPYVGYSYKFLKMDPGSELKFKHDQMHSLDYHLFFYARIQQAYRDLIPRWGQLMQLDYRYTPFNLDSVYSIFAAQIVLYFPGLFRHHGFRIYAGYQDKISYSYYYGDLINLPRGYSGIYSDRVLSGSVSYEFPIFYPDWHIGPVIYMKRLKAAVFYDHAWVYDTEPDQNYNSVGADLTLDFHLFRHFAPLEAGLRSIYFPESGTFGFEFLYSLNLAGIY
jgi:hypothetical protein